MVDGDDLIARQLQDEFPGWSIGRERDSDGRPNWWKARRLRPLTSREDCKGLSVALFRTTADKLREALAAEADLEAQIAGDPASLPEIARTTISRAPDQVRKAREWLRDLLGRNRPGADDAAQCLSELLTNSRTHTVTENIRVAVFADHHTARVEVTDDGDPDLVPHLCHHFGVVSEHGRGLALVHALSDQRWGTRADDDGRTTWFTVGLR